MSLQQNNVFANARLVVDGQTPQSSGRHRYLLERSDGTQVEARLKQIFFDPIPQVEINGQTYKAVEPLRWYQWVWSGLPVVLVIIGGLIGAIFGLLALYVNARLFRTQLAMPVQFAATAGVSLAAVVMYFILAIAIQIFLVGG
jgi:hypothetical protein